MVWADSHDFVKIGAQRHSLFAPASDNIGFDRDEVQWITVKFDSAFAPGVKTFDFDVNQVSITPDRAKVVDFSHGYYTVKQAVVAVVRI